MRAVFALAAIALGTVAVAADFSGKYEATSDGDKYELTLEQKGDRLSGEAKTDGQTLRLEGKVQGESATGTVTIAGPELKLPFRASPTTKGIKFELGEFAEGNTPDWNDSITLDFRRVGKAPEPEKPKSKVLEKFSKEPSATLKNGKEYTHASGGKFRYPKDWSLKEIEGAIQLLPPDATAEEAYVVVADSANGLTDPASSQVVDYVDGQVRELLTFVKRTGKVEETTSGAGKGAIVTWEGNNGTKLIQVRGFLTILKGYGVALIAAGPKATVEKRDKQLREVFATFGWGQGKTDPQLVGSWKHWSYSGSGSFGTERNASMVMSADGRFQYNGTSETSGSATGKDSLGNVTWTGGMAGRSGSGWSGTWTADGSTLILHFEDGSTETFRYSWKREGANTFLVVTEPGGKPKEWSRAG